MSAKIPHIHKMVDGSTALPPRIYLCINECTNAIYMGVYGEIKGCELNEPNPGHILNFT